MALKNTRRWRCGGGGGGCCKPVPSVCSLFLSLRWASCCSSIGTSVDSAWVWFTLTYRPTSGVLFMLVVSLVSVALNIIKFYFKNIKDHVKDPESDLYHDTTGLQSSSNSSSSTVFFHHASSLGLHGCLKKKWLFLPQMQWAKPCQLQCIAGSKGAGSLCHLWLDLHSPPFGFPAGNRIIEKKKALDTGRYPL